MTIADKMLPPKGLKVLVTAGASGIGAVIARAFREVEADVMICDVDDNAIQAMARTDPSIHCARCDVADEQQVNELFQSLSATLNGLDVLVNNAGIAGPTAPIGDISLADWQRTLDVNITGMFLCTRAAVPLLRQSSQASIINLSSVAGRLGYAFRSPYSASKYAVVGLTESLAKELGPDGIRVNALLPGIVRGERIERVFKARAETLGVSIDEVRQDNLDDVSLRTMVEPDDMAAMALHLCSPLGSRISGQSLSICGNVENI
jgi:NAD(P)-dependent dehydrogenase (short-subunit alcohol dehydrogenase family)